MSSYAFHNQPRCRKETYHWVSVMISVGLYQLELPQGNHRVQTAPAKDQELYVHLLAPACFTFIQKAGKKMVLSLF